MSHYADVEIGLFKREGDGYTVELRFSQPGSDADVRLLRGEPVPLQFDLAALGLLSQDSAAYADLLSKSLWSEPLRISRLSGHLR